MQLTDHTAPDVAAPALDAEGRRNRWATVTAIGAAFVASLCCIGPLLFVAFGVGAGLASTFEPVRPFFTALAVGAIAFGFWIVYGRTPRVDPAACGPDGSCAVPRSRTRDKALLWGATLVALVLLTLPQWSLWFL